MTDELIYECAICGKPHNDIKSRIACETKCLKEREAAEALKALEAERKKVEEIKKKKVESEKAINVELEKVNKMLKEYFDEYEYFNMSKNYYYLNVIFRKPTLWF